MNIYIYIYCYFLAQLAKVTCVAQRYVRLCVSP